MPDKRKSCALCTENETENPEHLFMPDKEGRAHFVLRTKLKTNNPYKTPDKESRTHFVLRTKLKVLRMKLNTHTLIKRLTSKVVRTLY